MGSANGGIVRRMGKQANDHGNWEVLLEPYLPMISVPALIKFFISSRSRRRVREMEGSPGLRGG